MLSDSFETEESSTAWHFAFADDIEEKGYPLTFGPSEPAYDAMLEQTGHFARLKKGEPHVMLVGAVSYSADEFMHYMRRINPRARLTIVDISAVALQRINSAEYGMTVKFVNNDGRSMADVKSSSTDAVFTNFLLHHLGATAIDMLRESHRVLKKDGGLFLYEMESYLPELTGLGFNITNSFEYSGYSRDEYFRKIRKVSEGYPFGQYRLSLASGTATYAIK